MKESHQETATVNEKPILAVKCKSCKNILYAGDWQKNLKVCSICGHHFRLSARERITLLVDTESFKEMDITLHSSDPLHFSTQSQSYREKLAEEREKSGMYEAVITGQATIDGHRIALAVMDFHFIGGSMGAAVGEKITRVIEMGLAQGLPVITVTASGGARMQEGIFSLMQMVKTTAALAKLRSAGVPYYSLITDPTTGGVTASFATLGDVILAEPGSLLCFAGPRVIEQFTRSKLPVDAVTSEFALQHGMIDAIVPRNKQRKTFAHLLRLYASARGLHVSSSKDNWTFGSDDHALRFAL